MPQKGQDMAYTTLSISNLALAKVGAKQLTAYGEDTTSGNAISALYETVRDEVLAEHSWSFAQKRTALVDITRPSADDWETGEIYAVDDEVYHNSTHYICLVANTASTFAADLAAGYWTTTTDDDWATSTVYYPGDQVYYSGVNYTCITYHTSSVWATDLNTNGYWVASQKVDSNDADGMEYVYYKPSDFISITSTNYAPAKTRVEYIGIVSDTDNLEIEYTYQCSTPTYYHAKFVMAFATKLAYELCFTFTESRTRASDLITEYVKSALPAAISFDTESSHPQTTDDNPFITAR